MSGDSLGEAFPKEQARCRQLLANYADLKAKIPTANVSFAVAMIEAVLARADHAAISGDVVEMIHAYEEMTGCA